MSVVNCFRLAFVFVLACSRSGWAQQAQIVHSLGDSKPQPWTSLDIQHNARDFQFAVVADNAGTPRQGIWREAMHKLNLLQPSFVMSVGDLIEGYVNTPEELNRQWDRFLNDLAPLQLPFFFVSGNHDVGRPIWYEVYRQRIGPTWYYFIYQDVLFLILDTNDGPEHGTGMSDAQLAWIESVMKEIPADKVRWTMIFQHKPLWNDKNPQWARINRMLANRQKVTVMAGHIHEYMSTQIDGIEYVALATTGGGSPLAGRDSGELDHITWVTMKDEGPIVANVVLDGILPIDFRTNASAQKYQSLTKGRFLQLDHIDQGQSEFSAGNSRLKIKNPDAQPLRVKVLFEPSEGIVVRPAAINATIPASGEANIELKVNADSPTPIENIQPIVVHWDAAYDRHAQSSLRWMGSHQLYIDGRREIPLASPKQIDGELDDWAKLPFSVTQPGEIHTNKLAWRGATDMHFDWGVEADSEFLYFAIKTRDNEPDHDGDMLWQDFAGVLVNPILKADAKPEEIKKEMFAVMAGLSMTPEDLKRYQFGNPPQGVQTRVKKVGSSVQYEFAIPTQRLDQLQDGRWSQLQLNTIVNDHDPSDEREGISVLYWRPRWDGLNHYLGSGIFQRQKSNSTKTVQ